jgi:hypothetical protein
MPRTDIPIADGFYRDESLAISARDCVNLFPHLPEGQSATTGALIGCSGIEEVCDTAANAFNRGGSEHKDKAYTVNGNKLWRIDFTTDAFGVRTYSAVDVSGSETIEGTARVFMSSNGDQLVIVAPDYANQFNAWIYTEGGGLVQISDADFDGPVAGVSYAYGFFLFPKKDSNKWFISDLRDGSAYIATDFASAESDPDPIQAIAPLNGVVYVFGSRTVEPNQILTGVAEFPFEAIPTGTQQKGCVAPASLIEADGNLIWIGAGENERPSIYATNGGQPVRVSTASVDNLIFGGGIEPVRNAYALRWAERGHVFVSFTVPGVCTIVYDPTTQKWHQRKSLDRFKSEQPWRVTCIIDAYSVLLVGDELSGIVGRMSDEIFYEYDDEIRRYFSTSPIDSGGRPFSIYQVQAVMETGTAPITGQGSDPVLKMEVSRDGGRSFEPAISRNIGKIGEYYSPIVFPPLGRFDRSACFRFLISEPIKVVFVKAEMEVGA